MLSYIHNDRLFPSEEEVPYRRAYDYRNAEPNVVRHKYEHYEVWENHLNHMKERLIAMHPAPHGRAEREKETISVQGWRSTGENI